MYHIVSICRFACEDRESDDGSVEEAGDRARSLPTTLETLVRGVSPVHLSWFSIFFTCLALPYCSSARR